MEVPQRSSLRLSWEELNLESAFRINSQDDDSSDEDYGLKITRHLTTIRCLLKLLSIYFIHFSSGEISFLFLRKWNKNVELVIF